jgi:ATP-dependent RNA helicase DDX3X
LITVTIGGGRWKDEDRRGGKGDIDWTKLIAKDERAELELFGARSTGINFNKYEDIPVDASGDNIPKHITSVSIDLSPVYIPPTLIMQNAT